MKGVRLRVFVVGALVVLPAAEVRAQPQPTCIEAEPSHEIQIALADRLAGRSLAAFDRLRALGRRCPSPRVHAQLALAEQSLQRWGDAYTHLGEALQSEQDPWIVAHRAELEDSQRTIREHLPQLAPQTNVPGAELWVDGVRVGVLPLRPPYALPTGTATIELRVRGYQTLRRVVSIENGEVYRETLTLEPARSVTNVAEVAPLTQHPARQDESRNPGLTQRIIGWSSLGVGVILGGVGIWQAWAWADLSSASASATPTSEGDLAAWARFQDEVNANRQMSASQVCDAAEAHASPSAPGVRELCRESGTRSGLALGLGLGGAVLAITGVVLVIAAPRATPARSSAQVGPWIVDGARGATVQVVF